MKNKESKKSDFRYSTGDARVPWAAVGENVTVDDIGAFIRFLVQPGDDPARYEAQYSRVKAELEKLLEGGRHAAKLTLGENVKALEEEVQEYLKVRHASFITNATAGFEIGFKLAGLKPGDEVIAPAITFLSTIAYPLLIGARVVLADVDPVTLNMDPGDVKRKITEKTKAIIPVHIGGYPCEMDAIMELAGEHGLAVIEDAAHGFGGWYKGKALGCIGDFGSYSFHEVKNITSLGEGGIVVTNSDSGREFPKARFGGFDISNPIDKWLYDVVALKGRNGHYTVSRLLWAYRNIGK